MLSGPGVIATILLLTSQAGGNISRLVSIAIAIALVFLVAYVSLYLGARLIGLVGEGGVHIATRVMGIVLAALAVHMYSTESVATTVLLVGREPEESRYVMSVFQTGQARGSVHLPNRPTRH